jgi:hypothetical protein
MTALSARMSALGATAEEVGQLIGRDAAEVETWQTGDAEPDAEALVRLRPFLADDTAAASAALNALRHRYTQSLRGDGATQAKVALAYGGGFAGDDAGRPQ